jgi:uncharacterized repeat protein (TIGR03803 family)
MGTIFRMTPNGTLTTLVSFNGANGAGPHDLVQGADGNFYGTTTGLPQYGFAPYGSIFQVTAAGTLTTLVSFRGPNGAYPWANLVPGADGNLYGTTRWSGTPYSTDTGLRFSGGDTLFKITTLGALTTLVSFTNSVGISDLVQGSNGTILGTTLSGGGNGQGTVFQVATNGLFTTLAEFDGANGASPSQAALVQGADGYFYGTTAAGGMGGGGTIFRLIPQIKFTSAVRQPDGNLRLNGIGPPNFAFRLWASSDVSLPFTSWTLLTSGSFDAEGNLSYTDAGVATHTSRFYRITAP